MRQVSVLTDDPYEVTIKSGLTDRIGASIRDRRLFLLTDENVWKLYEEKISKALQGIDCTVHVSHPGETAKSVTNYARVLELMAESGIRRDDLLLSFGGGVIGDLGGFCAATYLRGIDFIQMPTTLLAAVDSSVGGKTAINLSAGKNLAGAFYQPKAVWIDPALFATLSAEQVRDGAAEMIKTAVLFDRDLFFRLAAGVDTETNDLSDLLAECIAWKATVVREDEKDHGRRQLLNLGHTFGHAIEAASGFQISHGRAVGIGMAMMARAAKKRGFCSEETAAAIEEALIACGLSVRTDIETARLLPYIARDKKIRGATLQLVIPEAIGSARLLPVPADTIEAWLEDAND